MVPAVVGGRRVPVAPQDLLNMVAKHCWLSGSEARTFRGTVYEVTAAPGG